MVSADYDSENEKADVRFAKIDADLLTKSRFFSRVPGGIRTPDLPLRRRTHYPAVQRKQIQFLAYLLGFSTLRSHPAKLCFC